MTERSRSLCMFQELLPIGVKRTTTTTVDEGKRENFYGRVLKFIKSFFKSKKLSNSSININLHTSKSPLNPK